MTDLEIIHEIEKQSGYSLKNLPFHEVYDVTEDQFIKETLENYRSGRRAYTINERNQVVALSLDYITYGGYDYKLLLKFEHLKVLSLRGSGIFDIESFNSLKKLIGLDLAYCRLKNIPSIRVHAQLKSLSLRIMRLSDISFLSDMKELRTLDLSETQVADISILKNLVHLKELHLASNQVKNFEVFKYLTNLSILDLSFKQIKDPTFISNLVNLKHLYLADNQITDISFLKGLHKIESISLYSNQITDISVLGKLNKLKEISIGLNKIQDISPLKNLEYLFSLNLRANPIKDYSILKELKSLKILFLSSNKLSNISFLSNILQLEELYLGDNEITEASVLSNLRNLKKLHINKNKISDLSFASELSSIEELSVYDNRFSTIEAIKNLENIKSLDLGQNLLSDYAILKNFKDLNELILNGNEITDISFLKDNNSLVSLDLSENHITDIAPIKSLLNLKKLNLIKNPIKLLPDWITDFPHMEIRWKEHSTSGYMTFYDNPIEQPPIEIVKQGKDAINNYFESLKQGEQYLYEARILIIGEGESGKTTLARKILDKNAPMPDEKDTTKGIDVSRWDYEIDTANGDRNMRVNIWDFGGQSIYKATHRFFLSKRVLYVLLTDGRKEDTDFNYWLNLAEMFGGNSPLIITMNIKDGREYNIPMNILRGRFVNLKDEIKLNLKEIDNNYDVLINKIKHHISELPHIGNKLPESWTLIRKDIEEIEDKYIYHQQFFAICEKHGVTELEKILQISQFFHDIGVFLHFQESPQLGKILFLKNNWALDAAYAIIDDPHVKKQNGHFTKKEAIDIWGKDYFMVYEELLALMKRFYLIYEIDNSQSYIAPQLLLDDQPKYDWDEKDNLQLRYEYDDFMPQGILWQFIAIMHKQIKNNGLVWRSGVILSEGDTEAEITEVYGQQKINIRIRGKNRLDFRTIIAYELDKINQQYVKLKYEKHVPCICLKCSDNPNPYFFKYSKLKEIAQRGKRDIEYCANSDEEVSVRKLLEGVEVPKSLGVLFSSITDPKIEALENQLDNAKVERIKESITANLELLQQYEKLMVVEQEPKLLAKYKLEIEKIEQQIEEAKQELLQLKDNS